MRFVLRTHPAATLTAVTRNLRRPPPLWIALCLSAGCALSAKAFNNESIRTVAACREALVEARFEAEQRERETGNDGADPLAKVNTGA